MIEFSRNVLKKEGAHSTEIDPDTPHPVVIDMPEHNQGVLGGTMRLGKRETHFVKEKSITSELILIVDFTILGNEAFRSFDGMTS